MKFNPRALGKKWKLKKPRKSFDEVYRKKVSERMKGFWADPNNVLNSEVVRKRMSEAQTGINSHRWNPNREAVRHDQRNDGEYLQFFKSVKRRDKNKCRMASDDCKGYCIVHHILPWRGYPNERYNINNGITLCQAHHPMKRAEEQLLIPTFQELISQMD